MKRRDKDRADSVEIISPIEGTGLHPAAVPLDPFGQSFTVVVQVDPANGHSVMQVWAVSYTGNPPNTAIGGQPLDEVGGAGSGSDCYYGTLTAECETQFGIYATAEMTDINGAPVNPAPSADTGLVYTGVCDEIAWKEKKRQIRKHQRDMNAHKKAAKKASKKGAAKKKPAKNKVANAGRKKKSKK